MKDLPKQGVDEVCGGGLAYDETEVLPLPAPDYPQCPAPPVAPDSKHDLL